jgi:hypothetical protein
MIFFALAMSVLLVVKEIARVEHDCKILKMHSVWGDRQRMCWAASWEDVS